MKNANTRRYPIKHRNALIIVFALSLISAIVVIPIYSARSALALGNGASEKSQSLGSDAWIHSTSTLWMGRSTALASLLPIPQPTPAETITTFAFDCTTPRTAFILGETVCAQTNYVTESDRFVNWIDPNGAVAHGGTGVTNIDPNNQPQNFLYTPTVTGTWKATIADPTDSSIIPTVFTVSAPAAQTAPVATYEAPACVVPKTVFVLGETVCARAVGQVGFRFAWVDPAGFNEKRTAITTDPQTDTFMIPSTQTSVVNDTTVDNRGEWRVNIITSRGSTRASAFFTVKDPAHATVDLSINKTLVSDAPVAGAPVQFSVTIKNSGPDDAANVHFVDNTFTNATYNSVMQTAGLPFVCTGSTSADCTIAVFPKGSEAKFLVNFTAGTAGGNLENTATVSSSTTEQNPADNSFTSAPIIVGSSGTPPSCVLGCPDNINANADTTENGQRGTHVSYPDPTTSGTCGTVSYDHPSGSFFPVGQTVVTATSTQGNGSCSFTVTVVDQGAPPHITCPADQTANADNNCEAAASGPNPAITIGTPTISGGQNVTFHGTRSDGKPMYNCDCFPHNPDPDPNAEVWECNTNGACTRRADAPFSAGVTTITWVAYSHSTAGPYASPQAEENARTGSASCTQTITVNDVTPPNIGATDQTISADANCQATVPDYSNTVTDNCACASSDTSDSCAGHSRITVTQAPPAGTTLPPGQYPVVIVANDGSSNNDGAGNTSTKTITLTVADTTPPTIHCPANMTTNTEPGVCSAHVITGTATATDNCDTNPTVTGTRSDGKPLTDPYPGGTTTITWRATDSSGNHSECTQTITVEDHENPVIICPAPVVQGNDPGTCSATVNPGQPTATDNCGSPTVTGTRSDGQPLNAPYPKGTTTITWTATDGSGNHASCTQTVTVVDNEPPTFTFTGTQSMWPPNHKYHTFNLTDLVASVHDNCDGTIPVSSVIITKVTSDEAENGPGSGNTLNDIVIAADCKSVQLRSEREGGGDGRVYTIFFSVNDAAGNTGTGTTKVVVPHNPGQTAVDSGPHYVVTSNCP